MRSSVSATTSKARRAVLPAGDGETDAGDRDRIADRGVGAGLDDEPRAVERADGSDLPDDAGEHGVQRSNGAGLPNAAQRLRGCAGGGGLGSVAVQRACGCDSPQARSFYGSRRYASTRTSSPHGSERRWRSSRGCERSPRKRGPSPESTGATKRRSLSTSPASSERRRDRRAAFEEERLDAFVRERGEFVGERAAPQLEVGAVGKRAAPEGEAPRLARRAHVARVEPRRVGAHRPHPDRDGVGCRAQLVHAPPRLLARDPAAARHRDAPVERDRRLVRHERPAERLPRPPRLVLAPRGEIVEELDLDPCVGEPREAASVDDGIRDRARRRRRARCRLRRPRRRTAACGRDGSTARA